jgi:hypothetical protein
LPGVVIFGYHRYPAVLFLTNAVNRLNMAAGDSKRRGGPGGRMGAVDAHGHGRCPGLAGPPLWLAAIWKKAV